MKRYLVLFFVIALSGVLILPGCGMVETPEAEGFGGVLIAFDIPREDLNKVEGLDASHLENIILTLSHGSEKLARFIEFDERETRLKIPFDKLKTGTWEIEVEVKDTKGYTIFSGSGKTSVEADATTDISVDIGLAPGGADFEIVLPHGENFNGELLLKGEDGKTRKEEISFNNNSGSVRISELVAQNWEVGLDIRDANGDEIFYDFSPQILNLFPGRQGDVFLDLPSFDNDIALSTDWLANPGPVTGLEGIYQDDGLFLTWAPTNSGDLAGYRVFRSTEKDGVKEALNDDLTKNNEFFDEDIKGGQEYYYWVVSYLENGYSSSVNEPYRFYIEITEGFWGNISVKHNFPPPQFSSPNGFTVGEQVKETILQEEPTAEPIPGEFIVGFSSVAALSDVQAELETMGVEIVDKNRGLNAFLVRLEEEEVQAATVDLMNITGVSYVEPNYKMYALGSVPNDPRYDQQWHYPLIRLPQAWSITTGSNRVRVAVLDTGCDASHPDLGSRLDTAGGYNFVDKNDNTEDVHGHGTHVAGTIGAVTDNNQGVAGVMWAGEILPVKVLGDDGSGSYWAVGNGMLYAAGILNEEDLPSNPNPVDVINMSLGGPSDSEFIDQVVKEISAEGVIMVAAAGNSGGSVGYPAAFPEVIAVGALDHQKTKDNNEITLTSYSSRGPQLDILAPGGIPAEGVLSTVPGDGYSSKMGTSMAAPHVAGVIGLMLSEGIPAREVREIIKNTSTVFGQEISSLAGGGAPPGNGNEIEEGVGLINAYWAVSGVEEIQVFLGNRSGDTINAVAETSIDLKGGEYSFSKPPAGTYRVIAWIDVRGNGKIESGDYFVQSEEITFSEGEKFNINLNLEEIVD